MKFGLTEKLCLKFLYCQYEHKFESSKKTRPCKPYDVNTRSVCIYDTLRAFRNKDHTQVVSAARKISIKAHLFGAKNQELQGNQKPNLLIMPQVPLDWKNTRQLYTKEETLVKKHSNNRKSKNISKLNEESADVAKNGHIGLQMRFFLDEDVQWYM